MPRSATDGLATTVHGAQGETVDQAHLLVGESTVPPPRMSVRARLGRYAAEGVLVVWGIGRRGRMAARIRCAR